MTTPDNKPTSRTPKTTKKPTDFYNPTGTVSTPSVIGDKAPRSFANNPYQYDFYDETLQRQMAKNQGFLYQTHILGTSFAKMVAGSFISQIGATFDFEQTYNIFSGQETQYSNYLMDAGKRISDMGQEDLSSIERKDPNANFAFDDWGWWVEQTANVGTSFGMALAAITETAAISALTGGLGTPGTVAKLSAKVISTANQARKAGRLAKLAKKSWNVLKNNPTKAMTFAVLNRHGESVIEAADTFESMREEFLELGYTTEEATEYAAKAAATTYKLNMPMAFVDMLQYATLTYNPVTKSGIDMIDKMFKGVKSPYIRNAMKFALNMGSEGIEEGYQFIAQEEGSYQGRLLAGIATQHNFSARLNDYVQDPLFYESMFAGAYGSLLMTPVFSLHGRQEAKRLKKKRFESYKDFKNKNILGGLVFQTQILQEAQKLREQGQHLEAAQLEEVAMDNKTIQSLLHDDVNDKTVAFNTHTQTLQTLANLEKQSDEVIEANLINMGFTDENGFDKQKRLNLVKGKSATYQGYVDRATRIQEIYEEVKKEGYKGIDTIEEVVLKRLSLETLLQAKEDVSQEISEEASKSELTTIGEIEYEAHKSMEHGKKVLKKKQSDLRLLKTDPIKNTDKIKILEQEIQNIITLLDTQDKTNQQTVQKIKKERNLVDNRTEKQRKKDKKIIEKDLKNSSAKNKETEIDNHISKLESDLEVLSTPEFKKQEFKNDARVSIKLAETFEELNEISEALVKNKMMTTTIADAYNAKVKELNKKILEGEQQSATKVLKERSKAHTEVIKDQNKVNIIQNAFDTLEENLQETPIEDIDKKEDYTLIDEETLEWSPLATTHSQQDIDNTITFIETVKSLTEGLDTFETFMDYLVTMGQINPDSFKNRFNLFKLSWEALHNTQLTAQEVTQVASKILLPPVHIKNQPEIKVENTEEENKEVEKRIPIPKEVKPAVQTNSITASRFAYKSREYELVPDEEASERAGYPITKMVDINNQINETEYVNFHPLLNPNSNFVGKTFKIIIPSNAAEMEIADRSGEQGEKEVGKSKKFKEFQYQEGSQDWVDKIPMYVILERDGKQIPVSLVHQVDWYNEKNLFSGNQTLKTELDNDPMEKARLIEEARQEARAIRVAAIKAQKEGKTLSIEVTEQSTGILFTEKDNKNMPLSEASQGHHEVVFYEKGVLTGLPAHISPEQVLFNSEKFQTGVYHIRQISSDLDGTPLYMLLQNKYSKYSDTEFFRNAVSSMEKAIEIYLLSPYFQQSNGRQLLAQNPHLESEFGLEYDDLYKVYQELRNENYDLSNYKDVQKYIGNFSVQYGSIRGTENKAATTSYVINHLKEGVPYVQVLKNGEIVVGFSKQKLDSDVTLNPAILDTPEGLEKYIKLRNDFFEGFLDNLSSGKESMAFPRNKNNFVSNASIPLIVVEEGVGFSVQQTKDYKDFLADEILQTTVISYAIEDGGETFYACKVQPVFKFKIKGEVQQTPEDLTGISQKKKETEKREKVALVIKTKEFKAREKKTPIQEPTNISETLHKEFLEKLISEAATQIRFLNTQQEVFNEDTQIPLKSFIKGVPLNSQLEVIDFIVNNLFVNISYDNIGEINTKNLIEQIKELYFEHIQKEKQGYQNIYEQLLEFKDLKDNVELQQVLEDYQILMSQFEALTNKDNINTLVGKALEEFQTVGKLKENAENLEDSDNTENGADFTQEGHQGNERLFGTSFHRYSKISSSERVKWSCHGIPKMDTNGNVVKGFLGLPKYYSLNEIFDSIHSISTFENTETTIESFVENLSKHIETFPWLKNFLVRFDLLDKTSQIDTVLTFTKDIVRMKFAMVQFDYKTKSWNTSIWNTNANEVYRVISESWNSNFMVSGVVNFQNGEYVYQKENIKDVLKTIQDLKNELSSEKRDSFATEKETESLYNFLEKQGTLEKLVKGEYTTVNTLAKVAVGKNYTINGENYIVTETKGNNTAKFVKKEVEVSQVENLANKVLRSIGVDLNSNSLSELIKKGLRNTRGQTKNFQQQFEKFGLFSEIENFLNEIIRNPNEVAFNFDPSFQLLGKSIFSNLSKLDARYNTTKLTSSFRDNKKTISTYTDLRFYRQRFLELLPENSPARELLKKNAFSKESDWLALLEMTDVKQIFRENFSIDYVGLTAIKQMFKSAYRDNSLHKLDKTDLEFLYLTAFTDLKQGEVFKDFKFNGLSTRFATFISPTMSDKDMAYMVKTIAYNFSTTEINLETGQFNTQAAKVLYKQLVKPELNRIIHSLKIGETNLKKYDDVSNLFLAYPVLNSIKVDYKGNKISIQEYIEITKGEVNENLILSAVKPVLEEVFKQKVNEKIAEWNELEITYTELDYKDDSHDISKLDKNYLKKLKEERGAKTTEEQIKLAAYDFVLNSHIANSNQTMLFANDPAQYASYSQEDMNTIKDENSSIEEKMQAYDNIAKDTFINVGKRLAAMLAPRNSLLNANNEEYLQIFLEDARDISEVIKYKTLLLDGVEITDKEIATYKKALETNDKKTQKEILKKFPHSKDYFNINTTDAQELTTLSEHLHILESLAKVKYGEISLQEIEDVKKLLKEGIPYKNLTEQQQELFRVVFQPIKPVYTGQIWDENNEIIRSVYIKSSSFPLLPWITQGKEWDNLRIAMEDLEEISGKKVRASYQSANKVGALKQALPLFDVDGNMHTEGLSAESLLDHSLVLPRKYFGIQQNVPFDETSQEISLGTQESKIVTPYVGHITKEEFNYKGEKVSGKQIQEIYDKTFFELYNAQKTNLYNRLGIDINTGYTSNPLKTLSAINEFIQEEASTRGWSDRDKSGLNIQLKTSLVYSDGTSDKVRLNAQEVRAIENKEWDKLDPKKFQIEKLKNVESLEAILQNPHLYDLLHFTLPIWLNSNSHKIESLLNSIISNKIGKIKMPGNSFVLASEAGIRWTMQENEFNHLDSVIYMPGYTGEALMDSHVDQDGVFHPAQVLIPSKLRDNSGNIIDLLKDDRYYTVDETTGRKFLNLEMFSPEVLNMVSFRIPTSKLSSLATIEVVGFIPHNQGDLIITPKDFIVQKGLDFDVDKEYVYQYNTFINEEGKFSLLEEKYKEKTVEETLQELKKDLSVYRGVSIDSQNLTDEIDMLIWSGNEDLVTEKLKATADRKADILDELDAKYGNTGSVENLLQQLIEAIRTTHKDKERLLKNDIIALHHSILNNPNPEIQRNVVEVLSLDVAKKEADFFQSLQEQSNTNTKTFFTPYDNSYQIDKMVQAAGEKVGVGAYSLDVVMVGLLARAKNSKKPLTLRELIFDEDNVPVGWEVLNFNIGGTISNGELGLVKTLDGNRQISEVISERQNVMLDGAKEQIAWRVNLNPVTMDFDKVMNFLGFDLQQSEKTGDWHSISYSILSQPIIRDYVKIHQQLNAATNTRFVENKNEYIIKELLQKYPETGADSHFSVALADSTQDVFTEQILNPTSEQQWKYLNFFLEMSTYGNKLRSIETSLNVDSKGVGMNMSQVLDKTHKIVRNLKPTLIGNVSSVFGTPIFLKDLSNEQIEDFKKQGYIFFNNILIKPATTQALSSMQALNSARELWLPFFPHSHSTFKLYKKHIESNVEEVVSFEEEENYNLQLEEDLIKAYQMFYNTSESGNLFQNQDVDVLREYLMKDEIGSMSLGSYILKLKQTQDKNVRKLFDNRELDFLNLLTVEYRDNGIILVKYNNTTQNLNEEEIHNSIINLYNQAIPLESKNGQPYTTRDLVNELVAYSYLEGGVQEAIQFIKLIPHELLEKKGFVSAMQILNNQLKYRTPDTTKNQALPFVTQFFQHFPKRAESISLETIKNDLINEGKKIFKVNNLMNFKLTDYAGDFLKIYNSSEESNYSLFMYDEKTGDYKKIPTYASFGAKQFNAQRTEVGVAPLSQESDLTKAAKELKNGQKKYVVTDTHFVINVLKNGVNKQIAYELQDTKDKEEIYKLLESQENKENGNALSILEAIKQDSTSEMNTLLCDLLAKTLKDRNIKVLNVKGRSFEGASVGTDLVLFNENLKDMSREDQQRVILHEFLHLVYNSDVRLYLDVNTGQMKKKYSHLVSTDPKIQAIYQLGLLYQKAIKKFEKQHKQLKERKSENTLGEDLVPFYGLTSVSEFVSELMTSPSFQQAMANTEVQGLKDKSFFTKFKELVTKYLNSISKNLGFTVKENSITAQGIEAIITAINPSNPIDIQDNDRFTTMELSPGKDGKTNPIQKFEDINADSKPLDILAFIFKIKKVTTSNLTWTSYTNLLTKIGNANTNLNRRGLGTIKFNRTSKATSPSSTVYSLKDFKFMPFAVNKKNQENRKLNRQGISTEAQPVYINAKDLDNLFKQDPKKLEALYAELGITYTNENFDPCAKQGGKNSNFTKGSKWEIVKDLKGKPKHSNGGVDITISNKGVTMRRGGKDIKAKHGLLISNDTKGTDWKIVKDFKGQPKHSQGGVDITISDNGISMRKGDKDIKAQYGLLIPAQNLSISNPDNPPFDEWYKTVPKEKNDTTSYNLRRAYELAPKEQLDEFVKNPDAHLYSVYENQKTGEYEFMKSKNHPTLKYEIDWYNSEEGKEFRNNYDLDMTNEYYKYIPKIKK